MEKVEVQTRSSLKPLIITVGVVLAVLVVGCTVFISVFMTQQNKKLEWIAFNGGFPHKEGYMHEESEVDPERKTILHVNAEGWRLNINSTISLHDYAQGILATKLMEESWCMIIQLIDTYDESSAALAKFKRTGFAAERPVREFDSGTLIPQDQLTDQIGSRLANFCRGSPTYRLNEVPAGTIGNRTKRAEARTIEAVCVQNTFTVVRCCYV